MSPIGTQVANIALNYGLFTLTKRLDLTDPYTIRCIEAAFYTFQLLIIATLLFIRLQIQRKGDRTPVPMPNGAPATSVQDYDLAEVGKALQSQFVYLVFMSVLHFKWQFVRPLVFQTLPPLLAVLQGNLAKAHIWAREGSAQVQRPFKVANPLEGLMAALQPKAEGGEKELEIEQVEDVTEAEEAREIVPPKVVKRSRKEL